MSRVEVHAPDNLGVTADLSKSRTNLDADIKLLEKISLSDGSKPSSQGRYSESSDYTIKDEDASGITVIEIKSGLQKASSVISYDSIYLSSESSEGKQTVFEDPNCAVHRQTENDLIAISIEVYDDPTTSEFARTEETTIDTLYSHITKPYKTNSETGEPEQSEAESTLKRGKNDPEYNSLPDAEIGHILRKSERIDAKLRYSYRDNGPLEEPLPDYDTVIRPRQALPPIPSGPSSLDEADKGAPSIEVIPAQTKELEPTKIFLQDLGLEIDYENSICSDLDSEISEVEQPPSVSLSGKKIIIDEVAAKVVKRPSLGENIYDEVINLDEKIIITNNGCYDPGTVVRAEKVELELNGDIKKAREKLETPSQEHDSQEDSLERPEKKITPCTKRGKEDKNSKDLRNLEKIKKNSKKLKEIKEEKEPKTPENIQKKYLKDTKEAKDRKNLKEVKEQKVRITSNSNKKVADSQNKQKLCRTKEQKKEPKKLVKPVEPSEDLIRFEPSPEPIPEETATELEDDGKPITVLKVTTYSHKNIESGQSEPLTAAANALKISTFSSLIKEAAQKMPRPQLLQIVDKRGDGAVKLNSKNQSSSKEEFQHKVEHVRNYWSKILEEVQHEHELRSLSESVSTAEASSSRRTSIESSHNSSSNYFNNSSNQKLHDNDDFQSFMPTVEIVELDGQKKAAIVKAKNFDEVDFDHVRYRVIKSDVFQKQMLINHRKEAQFDGLLQYLQDYSFQELLANNNVVIIEPVRTKIEKPGEKQPIAHSIHCKITGGAGGHKKNALRSHFFYQPVRVNKELLDEELPSPDTVRNVRRMFEHRFGLGATKPAVDDSKINTSSRNTDTLRKKALRYLSIDTSINHAGKWDSGSLSSGVSSGDLSSPCECNDERRENNQQKYASEEHLCGNNGEEDEFESRYVSQDILEKIRERGSSVTYYGGRMVKNMGGHVSEITKALMKQINESANKTSRTQDDFLGGMKFKLIKSNSCSSRLELAGTGRVPPDLDGRRYLSPSPETVKECDEEEEDNDYEHRGQSEERMEPEESVRDIISKLEHRTSSEVNLSKPRPEPRMSLEQPVKETPEVQVNHVNFSVGIQPSQRLQKRFEQIENRNKISRNKNVDLAFSVVTRPLTDKTRIKEVQFACTKLETIAQSPDCDPDDFDTKHSSPSNDSHQPSSENQYDSLDEADSGSDEDTLVYTISNEPTTTSNHQHHNHHHINGKTGSQNKVLSVNNSTGDNNSDVTSLKPNNKAVLVNNNGSTEMATKTNTTSSDQSASGRVNNKFNGPKIVSWTTVGKFDGKLYCVNDKRLIEKPKYDEMEFEEFEVYDPSTMPKPENDDENNGAQLQQNGGSDKVEGEHQQMIAINGN